VRSFSLDPDQAYSPASIGRAYLRAMGIRPILERQPDFPMPEGVELKKIDSITGEFREDGNMEAAFPIAANEN